MRRDRLLSGILVATAGLLAEGCSEAPTAPDADRGQMEPTELCAPSACYVGYTAKDIGTLGGLRASVNAINDAGVVVGWSELQSGLHHAFRYSDGAMLDLGTLPGDKESYAVGTNEAGEIVGTSVGIGIRAFLWRPWVQPGVPHVKDLGPLAGARPGDVQAGGINNNGEVVGRACCIGISSDVDVAFRWTSAGMAQLRGLYAGAFENPEQSSLAATALRVAGVTPVLEYRTGRIQ